MSDKLNKAAAVFGKNVGAAPKQAKTKTEDKKEKFEVGKDLDTLAALATLATTFANTAEIIKEEIKDKARTFYSEKMHNGKTAETMTAVGTRSEAEIQIRKRASNSVLTEDDVAALRKFDITLEDGGIQKITTVPERLVINPEILENQTILKALAEAIEAAPKLKGVPVILQQEAEEVFVTTDETIAQIGRKAKTATQIEELLRIASVISLGKYHIDKLTDASKLMQVALEIVAKAKLIPAPEKKKSAKA